MDFVSSLKPLFFTNQPNVVQDVDTSQVQSMSSSQAAPVYDFYEIDKCFPPTNPNDNVMEGEEQRLIPIYICKPLRQVAKMSPLELEQAELLKELDKIDQMEIEVVKLPEKKNKMSRKTRLIPLAFVSDKGDVILANVGKSPQEKVKVDDKKKVEDINDSPAPEEEMKIDPGVVDLIKKEIPEDEEVNEDPMPVPEPVVKCPSPPRSESPEKPQFQCDRCEKSFYLKRLLLRHLYSHKND